VVVARRPPWLRGQTKLQSSGVAPCRLASVKDYVIYSVSRALPPATLIQPCSRHQVHTPYPVMATLYSPAHGVVLDLSTSARFCRSLTRSSSVAEPSAAAALDAAAWAELRQLRRQSEGHVVKKELSIVQEPFSVAPCETCSVTIRMCCVAVRRRVHRRRCSRLTEWVTCCRKSSPNPHRPHASACAPAWPSARWAPPPPPPSRAARPARYARLN
jgi:hypothetical protein